MTYKWEKGQVVAVTGWGNYFDLATIERVTPKGFAIIGSDMFNGDGRRRGEGKDCVCWRTISPISEEIIEGIVRASKAMVYLETIANLKGASLSMDQLERIVDIINEG